MEFVLQFEYLGPVCLFQSHHLCPQLFVFDDYILVLVQDVVLPEFQLRYHQLALGDLLLQFDKFILEVDPSLPFVVQLVLQALSHLLELQALPLQPLLHLGETYVVGVLAILSDVWG